MLRNCGWTVLAGLVLLAAAADAPAGPLSECYAISASRVEIGPCLNRKLAEAEADCTWSGTRLASGTGAGDVTRDCLVHMTRARAAELKAEAAPGRAAPRPRAHRLRRMSSPRLLATNGGTRLTFER